VELTHWIPRVAEAFDVVGAAVLVVGFIWSVVLAARTWRSAGGAEAYRRLRTTFGGVLLLGLEILVAADLVRTVAVSPTLQNVIVLGLIVVIRTFLSFSLQVEIDGSLPWQRSGAQRRRTTNEPVDKPTG
jgi:uncharacterized membrane protein